MKSLIYISILLIIATSCSSTTSQNIVKGPVLVAEQELPDFTFKDQFDNSHTIDASTEKLIFAFGEEPAHAVNDFLADKPADFLKSKNTLFIADVSAAPGVIRKMFILPGLKKFKYPVLIFTDEEEAAPFRKDAKIENVIIVHVKDKKITSLEILPATTDELKQHFKDENK